MTEMRKVHVLDDVEVPDGPMLCGKTSVEVLGGELVKGDVLCRKCAAKLLARVNDYASRIELLCEFDVEHSATIRELRSKIRRKDKMLLELMERFLDPEVTG